MLKGSLIYKVKGRATVAVEPLVLAPVVLRDSCSAVELWRAINLRMPSEVKSLMDHASHVGVLLGHDSHRANLRYIDASLATKEPEHSMISSRCAMHQLQICLKDAYTLPCLSFHNELYCACRIFQQGRQLGLLKSHMHGIVRNIKIDYQQPSPVHAAHSRRVMEMLFFRPAPAHVLDDDDPDDHYSDDFIQHLREVGERFLTMFNGDWTSGELVHHCGSWCGRLDDETARKACLEVWGKVIFYRHLG